jgi:hypothetical protein
MIIQDRKQKIRAVWSGYLPKIFDGNFLELFKDKFKTKFNRAGIINNTHFEWRKQALKILLSTFLLKNY